MPGRWGSTTQRHRCKQTALQRAWFTGTFLLLLSLQHQVLKRSLFICTTVRTAGTLKIGWQKCQEGPQCWLSPRLPSWSHTQKQWVPGLHRSPDIKKSQLLQSTRTLSLFSDFKALSKVHWGAHQHHPCQHHSELIHVHDQVISNISGKTQDFKWHVSGACQSLEAQLPTQLTFPFKVLIPLLILSEDTKRRLNPTTFNLGMGCKHHGEA